MRTASQGVDIWRDGNTVNSLADSVRPHLLQERLESPVVELSQLFGVRDWKDFVELLRACLAALETPLGPDQPSSLAI